MELLPCGDQLVRCQAKPGTPAGRLCVLADPSVLGGSVEFVSTRTLLSNRLPSVAGWHKEYHCVAARDGEETVSAAVCSGSCHVCVSWELVQARSVGDS